ncbi:MAG: prepilin-type N-terminal cleavage/methylation domain-containing protein [Verrucomicrobiota bacterium]
MKAPMFFVKRTLKQRHAASFRGLTLIELLVVIVILGLLAAALFPAVSDGRPTGAKIAKARVDMIKLDQAIRLYRV